MRVGETLPPEIRGLLDRLGVWDRFAGDGHATAPGILAAWGQPDPYANDFLLNPYGLGWRVDRARFDAMLADAAAEAGAVVCRGSAADGCEREASGDWLLTAGGGALRLRAEFVVDAAGRASPLRARLGGQRVVHDRLVAVMAVLAPSADTGGADRRALIEATEHGWWYSAVLPDGRLVVGFHTDAAPDLRASWARRLADAPHTAGRVAGRVPTGLRHVAANSVCRDPVAGKGWLAAGDAAASHDPIAGLGVYWAIESGLAAADAIAAQAAGDTSARKAYTGAAAERFREYLAQRRLYYRAEPRWPEAPFWRARQRTDGPG